jgi:hypothetical protein
MEETTRVDRSTNGHKRDALVPVGPPEPRPRRRRNPLDRAVRGIASRVSSRLPVADLD